SKTVEAHTTISPANLPLRIANAGTIKVFGKKKLCCNVGSQDYREVDVKDRTVFDEKGIN
ncbi:hypothetical protein, partial [Yersinia frederiksenii]|uniref:hypothetical protein n=1 Tax=Yersinia frederiksenii TaxID=29484 RepID=UPI001C980DB4